MALTITLPPEVEARLRQRAADARRTPEDVAAEWIALQSEGGDREERLRRFDEGIARLRRTMGEQPAFPDRAYDRAFAHEG